MAPVFLLIENSQKCDGALNRPGLACTITWPEGSSAAGASAQVARPAGNEIEGPVDKLEILPPLGSELDASRFSNEELDAEVLLQFANMMTDGALRDEQFLPRPAEAQEPGDRRKRAQRLQWREGRG